MFYDCEYGLDDIKNALLTDSYLQVVSSKYKELFFKAGYVFKGTNDKAVAYLNQRFRMMDYCSNNIMALTIKEIAGDLIDYSNAFLVKIRVQNIPDIKATPIGNNKKIVGAYHRIDPCTVSIKYDQYGTVTAYKQSLPNNITKEYNPQDIIHFVLNRPASSQWGTPTCIAVLDDIKMLRQLEGNTLSLVYRYAVPFIHAKVGGKNSQEGATQKEIDDLKHTIEHTPTDGVLVTSNRAELTTVGTNGAIMDFAPYLSYCENRVFSGLNVSQAMMGRGGAKQDADSMEEQVHNRVKDMQAVFSLQFQNAVINELLIEGGYNPVINEDDIVGMVFNEINLDTKVKMENHEINKFEKNAITYSELRNHLGEKQEVDDDELYTNKFTQKHKLEQIKASSKSAQDLLKLKYKLEKESATESSTNGLNNAYDKRITGNGKTTDTTDAGEAVDVLDNPTNQYGTTTAKVKEFREHALTQLATDKWLDAYMHIHLKVAQVSGNDNIAKTFADGLSDMLKIANASLNEAYEAGICQMNKELGLNKHIAPSNVTSKSYQILKNNMQAMLENLCVSIQKQIKNKDIKDVFETQAYRLKYAESYYKIKAFWLAYTDTAAANNVKYLIVKSGSSRRHDKHNNKIIKTTQINLADIPAFSANCTCYMQLAPIPTN